MRRVKQVGALAPQIARNGDLLADRVAGRRLRNRAKIVAELADELPVGLAAEHDVLCRLIDAREVSKQVPDVGADPVVAELAGIDGYAQGVEILSAGGSAPFRRKIGAQQPGPARMMLLVEGDLAATIGRVHRQPGRWPSSARAGA